MRPWLGAAHLDSVRQSQIDRVKGDKKLIGTPKFGKCLQHARLSTK